MPMDVEKDLIEVKIPRLFAKDMPRVRNRTDNESCHPFVIQFFSVKSGYGSLQKEEILS